MSEEKLKEIDKSKLPFFYRLILKVPEANFLENTSSGIFWAIIVPTFLVLEFFLNLFLLYISHFQ